MKTYNDKKISGYHHRNPSLQNLTNIIIGRNNFSHKEFNSCTFELGSIFCTSIKNRTIIENIQLKNCEFIAFDITGPIIRNVVIDGLKTNRMHFIEGVAFHHVVIRGRIGKFIITPFIGFNKKTKRWRDKLDDANSRIYSEIDWALDISEAYFEDFDIRGIPSRLIKLNPKTQITITREKALSLERQWKQLELPGTYWIDAIKNFLEDGKDEKILVASKSSHFDYGAEIRGIDKLREIGFGENDIA